MLQLAAVLRNVPQRSIAHASADSMASKSWRGMASAVHAVKCKVGSMLRGDHAAEVPSGTQGSLDVQASPAGS